MTQARGARSARAPLTCLLTIFATSFLHFSTWLAGMPGGGGGSCIGILPLLHGDAAATAQRRRSRMGVAMVPEKSLLAGTAESSPWGAFRVIAVSAVPRPSSCERRIDQMPFLEFQTQRALHKTKHYRNTCSTLTRCETMRHEPG